MTDLLALKMLAALETDAARLSLSLTAATAVDLSGTGDALQPASNWARQMATRAENLNITVQSRAASQLAAAPITAGRSPASRTLPLSLTLTLS